jgi:hypothetical protein
MVEHLSLRHVRNLDSPIERRPSAAACVSRGLHAHGAARLALLQWQAPRDSPVYKWRAARRRRST